MRSVSDIKIKRNNYNACKIGTLLNEMVVLVWLGI